jgi:hypothetical protein
MWRKVHVGVSVVALRMRVLVAVAASAIAVSSHAQWRTQTVSLNPGWNAIYLEVQPEPSLLDWVFTNSAIESVWKWDRRFSHIQYVTDPYTLLPEDPHWLVWLPTNDARRFLSRLFELQGDQAYLVKVATNTPPFTVPVKGRVIIPPADWFPHGLNLKGFPVHTNNPPTFSDFFKFTPEVDLTKGVNNQLFTINSAGRGVTIVQPARDKITPGRAYWVGCARDPKYMGPLHVVPSGGGAVDFGSTAIRQELTIYNVLSTTALAVRVTQEESEPAPEGFPELAGPVPLSYEAKNASNRWEWYEFPPNGLTQTIPAGGSWTLYLGVRRQDFESYTPVGTNGYSYQSILKIEDAARSLLVRVPVVAEPASGGGRRYARDGQNELDEHHENEGLWVGAAVLDHVNAPAYEYAGLMPTPAPASLRLIVHVDGYGRSRLLQQVLLAWDSSLTNAPHTNGTYALFVDEADVPANAEDVHRISSVAFPLMPPLTLAGEFTNILTGTVAVNFDDPTNPFLHRYHPMHDNKDWDFNPYTNAVETRTIVREITLDFDDPPTNLVHHPYWGVDQALGTYRETLIGLRAQPVVVEGSFWLERISRINKLK